MSCSRTQHGGGRFRTPDLLLRSPTLYHWATALPCSLMELTDIFTANYKQDYPKNHDKTNKMSVRPAKTQISLGIRPVWSESSLCAQWVAKGPRFLHADTRKICCNHPKIWTKMALTSNRPRQKCNSVDPDQITSLGAVWSGSALFA